MPVSAPVGSVINAAQPSQRELRLRFKEQSLLIIKALAVFYADAVGVFLIAGFIRILIVGVQVRIKDTRPRCDIGISTFSALPDTVQTKGCQFVLAAALSIITSTVAVVHS